MQNTSHAVMSQRIEPKSGLDDFPTPPWATRALCKHIIPNASGKVWEPACNRGYMVHALSEYFGSVKATDIHPYGFGDVQDFLTGPMEAESVDWMITNPPFKNAQEFIERGLVVARSGVAILARTVFMESVGRYNSLFSVAPPSVIAQFSERVPMIKGRVDPKASTATGYAWFVWEKQQMTGTTRLEWIPPCRRKLEREGDYSLLLNRSIPSRNA